MLERHPLNDRKQDAVKNKYKAGVKEYGVIPGVRGQVWAIRISGTESSDPPRYQLISHWTLAAATYDAWEEEPENPQVATSVRNGLSGVVFSDRTPDDIIKLLRDQHNSFHHGSSKTLVEMAKGAEEVEQSWASYKKKVGGIVAATHPEFPPQTHMGSVLPKCALILGSPLPKHVFCVVRCGTDHDFPCVICFATQHGPHFPMLPTVFWCT